MKNRVITISREFGSGGRTIGKKVEEKLGIPCYDAEIIQEMAKETGFAPDYVKEAGEYAPGSFLSAAFSNRMFGPTNEDILWEHQYKVITELAEKGPCVIVGRCADLYSAGQGRLPEGLYPRGYEVPCGAHRQGVRRTGAVPGGTFAG